MLGDARIDAALEAAGRGLTVLVIRLGAMGDIVRTLPAVRLVRFGLPDARVYWAAWAPWTELLRDHAEIDGVIELPRSRMRQLAASPLGWPRLVREIGGIAARVRGLRAALVLDFHGDLRSGLLGRVSGAPVRLGYAGDQQKEGNRFLTTHRVPAGPRRISRLERNLALVRALGLPADPAPDAGLAIPDASERAATEIAALAGPAGSYAILGPGASRRQAYKKPPAPLFGAAAAALAERGVTPIVAAGPGEEADAARVVEAARGAAQCAPPTSLMTLAALLRRARMFVGGDTGPLHLACGVGCPVVGLYGPTDPVVNAPWNVPHAALAPVGRTYTGIKSKDRAAGGFEGLEPAAVADAVAGLLAAERAETP